MIINMGEDEPERNLAIDDLRHITAAEGYLELGMCAEAGAELDQIDPLFWTFSHVLTLKLCVYAGLERWDLMKTLAEKMARHDPANAQWRIFLASATQRSQTIESAKQILLQALQHHPDDARIHYNLSCYETRLQHFKQAQRHLARAIQLDPRFRLIASNDQDLEPLWDELRRQSET